MDDDKLLNELRAQRKLVQKHLDWLDQKIAALKKKGGQKNKAPDEALPKAPTDLAEKILAPEKGNDAPRPAEEDEALDEVFSRYKAPTANELQRAKIGCLVLFILSTLLFLFLSFGLPYLMNW